MEHNPDFHCDRWTRFRPASGRFAFDYGCFHPSRYQRLDGQAWGDMPDLCHRNPIVYDAVMEHATMLIAEIGFDGFRFDFVKGYGAWMVRAIHERQYVRDAASRLPFGVGESWSGENEIDAWLDEVNRGGDNPVSAFDFPLRYRLKEMCDSYGFSLRRLAEHGTVVETRPELAVTFVDNHDFRGGDSSPIVNDKLMAYAFILTHPGYPCVFWQDYFEQGLGRPGSPGGIAALVAAHERNAAGEAIVRHVDDDLYVMERTGWQSASRAGVRAQQPRRSLAGDVRRHHAREHRLSARRVVGAATAPRRSRRGPRATAAASSGPRRAATPSTPPPDLPPVPSPRCGEKVTMRCPMGESGPRDGAGAPGAHGDRAAARIRAQPPAPAPGMLRLRVAACGVCRTDLQLCEGDLATHDADRPRPPDRRARRGRRRRRRRTGASAIAPASPGWRAPAASATSAAPGARTCARDATFTGWDVDGGYATHVAVRADFALRAPGRLRRSSPRRRCCAAA